MHRADSDAADKLVNGRTLAQFGTGAGGLGVPPVFDKRARLTVYRATGSNSHGARRVSEWVSLIRQQFQQTPHLSVTAEQASRLWGLETAELEAVLSAFVDAHLLDRTRSGAYVLRSDPADGRATGGVDFAPNGRWQGCAHM